MKRSVLLSGLVLLAGAGCIDFDSKENAFCEGLPPEQWVAACKDKAIPPAQLVLTTSAPPARIKTCSGEITAQVSDEAGQPVRVTGATFITLSADPAIPVRFFSDPTCATPAANVIVNPGWSTASFYVQGDLVGMAQLTASSAGLASATLGFEITGGPPAILTITSRPQTVTAGACSGAVIVQPVDGAGNFTRFTTATTLNLSASGGTFSFFSDAGCTSPGNSVPVPAGSGATKVYFQGITAGQFSLTAGVPGLEVATQGVTVQPTPPATLRFGSDPQTVSAGSMSRPVVVQLFDSYGNVTSGSGPVELSVTFRNFASSVSFCSASACFTCSTPRGCTWPWTIPAGRSVDSFTFVGSAAGFDYSFSIDVHFAGSMTGVITQSEAITQL